MPHKINRLLKYILFGTFIILLCSTISLADDNTQVVYPINMCFLRYDATGPTYYNETVQTNTSLIKASIFRYATPTFISTVGFEWNLSEIPFNSTIKNVNFSYNGICINYENSGNTGPILTLAVDVGRRINESSNVELYNDLWVAPIGISVQAQCLWSQITPNGEGVSSHINYSFFNGRLQYIPASGENLINASMSNITNATSQRIRTGIYMPNLLENFSIATSINTTSYQGIPQKPKLTYNYSYTKSYVNSTISNNSETTSTYLYYYNITNPYSNRSKYCLYLYDINTGVQTTLLNYSFTNYTGTSYNQSLTYGLTGLTIGHSYLIWVRVIGNTSFVMDKIYYPNVPGNTNSNITVHPINEGYVLYEAGGGTHTKYTPWADNIRELNQTYALTVNIISRIFFEWNISHYIPVDAVITAVNFTYWSDMCQITTGTVNDYDFCFIAKNNINTTNASSAESLFDEIYYGPSLSSASLHTTNWFAGPNAGTPATPSVLNKSTYNFVEPGHEGYWWLPGTASGRSIRDALADNISTSRDRLIMGGYCGGIKNGDNRISSSINTSAPTRPYLYINCTYNLSISNGTDFTNNSENVSRQPWINFNIQNNKSSPISYYIMLYNSTSGHWTEEIFNRTATSGNQTIQLLNATAFSTTYIWYLGIVGNSTIEMFSFTTTGMPYAQPPTNVTVHDYNATTVNISYTPFNWSSFTTHTVCYYQEEISPPMYGTGTLAGNTTGNDSTSPTSGWFNITGLTKSTAYTFSFWTWVDSTEYTEYAMLSENHTDVTNTTRYGTVTFVLRYENTSADGYNSMINLSLPWFRNSSHRLIIHYANLSDTIYYFNSDVYNASGFKASMVVSIKYKPLYYELQWNDSYYGGNLTNSYSRVLTRYAEEESGGSTFVTFYIQTDMHIYGAAYIETVPIVNSSGNITYTTQYTLNEYFEGSLANYLYQLQDYSGYFTGVVSSDNYITIFAYNDTKKLIIDQRFVGADGLIGPVLVYGKQYRIGVASLKYPDLDTYYQDIGPLVPGQIVAPSVISIIINSYEQVLLEQLMNQLTWNASWYPSSMYPTNIYLYMNDYSHGITYISFTVYNYSNGSALYFQSVNNTYEKNFSYPTSNRNISYRMVINLTYNTRNYSYVINKVLYFVAPLHNVTGLENVLIALFGDSPFFGNGSSLSLLSWGIMIICMILAGMFVANGHPVLGLIIPGFVILGLSGLLTGITLPTMAGGLMIIIGFLYAYAQGSIGVER